MADLETYKVTMQETSYKEIRPGGILSANYGTITANSVLYLI